MSYKSMSDGKGSLAIQSEIIGRLEKKERRKRESAPEGASRFFATTSQMHLSLTLLFPRFGVRLGHRGKASVTNEESDGKGKGKYYEEKETENTDSEKW